MCICVHALFISHQEFQPCHKDQTSDSSEFPTLPAVLQRFRLHDHHLDDGGLALALPAAAALLAIAAVSAAVVHHELVLHLVEDVELLLGAEAAPAVRVGLVVLGECDSIDMFLPRIYP